MEIFGSKIELNIVCVSKKKTSEDHLFSLKSDLRHLPITGAAKVYSEIDFEQKLIPVAKTFVDFQGIKGNLISVDYGLDGSAVVIGVEVGNDPNGYDIWWLYTDIPKQENTVLDIRRKAERAISIQEKENKEVLRRARILRDS